MERLTITIPGLPPINSADGTHRWARRKIRDQWTIRTCAAVRTALGGWPTHPLERAEVVITRCSTTEPDADNLAAGSKFLLDGLVRANVIRDDSPSVIDAVFRWERAPRGQGCVRIDVRDLGGAEGRRG